MKTWIKLELSIIAFAAIVCFLESCAEIKAENNDESEAVNIDTVSPKKSLSQEFKDYWFAGEAEITSYGLEQARYGELRKGTSVLIYVTEPFDADKQVKADVDKAGNIPVLKLNSTKNYLTGIYPYSIMGSSFYPLDGNQQALKVTFSAQEWCGQVFTQMNNREKLEISSFSYFESEGDTKRELEKNIMEDELWSTIRINPDNLPIGNFEIIPSIEYIRLHHKDLKAYSATTSLTESEGINKYRITYPTLERTLEIEFGSSFPFTIEGWSESFRSGFGDTARIMTSSASKIKTIKTPYWQQNGNNNLSLRDTLGL